jgi:hypothetical protein
VFGHEHFGTACLTDVRFLVIVIVARVVGVTGVGTHDGSTRVQRRRTGRGQPERWDRRSDRSAPETPPDTTTIRVTDVSRGQHESTAVAAIIIVVGIVTLNNHHFSTKIQQ